MHTMSLSVRRRPEPAGEPERGRLTGVPLNDVRCLRLPPVAGPFGRARPRFDETALKLSLELAYTTYTLDLDPWMRAGWTDISIQVDNRLESGVTVGESESAGSERIRGLINNWKLARARLALKEYNPLSQVAGALRQRERSDTIKAITMLHPAGNGRYVVAVGFMGTGSRFYDWFSNLRFTTEEGFHKGFHQLTQVFEQSAPRIRFPGAAAALGRPSLTLSDILAEMRSPRSRFTLWMAGHSQGGAVMQIFCHRLMSDWGIPARNIIGYGFASPTTAVGGIGRDPADYPLFHILNSDDLVPRIGALVHLGLALEYPADDALRAAAYGWGNDPEEVELRGMAEGLCRHITDMPTLLESLAAFCEAVIEEKTEESLNALMEKRWSIPALDRAFSFAGNKAKDQLRRFVRYDKVAYRTLMARRMDESVVTALLEEMRPTVAAVPVRKLMAAFQDRLHPPHMLSRPQNKPGAYGYIVRRGSAALRPFVWVGVEGGRVRRVFTGEGIWVQKTACSAPYRPARPSARTRGIGSRRCARRGNRRWR